MKLGKFNPEPEVIKFGDATVTIVALSCRDSRRLTIALSRDTAEAIHDAIILGVSKVENLTDSDGKAIKSTADKNGIGLTIGENLFLALDNGGKAEASIGFKIADAVFNKNSTIESKKKKEESGKNSEG